MQALILAGGKGTRLRPLTVYTPKPIVPVVNRPFLLYQLDILVKAGITRVTLSLSYQPNKIEDLIGDSSDLGVDLKFITEPSPLGTAGAFRFSNNDAEETTLVLNGDILTDLDISEIIATHEKFSSEVTIALKKVDDPSKYGLVHMDSGGRITRFIEKPKVGETSNPAITTINAGIYVLEPTVRDLIAKDENVSFEYGVFPALLNAQRRFYGHDLMGAYWLDIGTPESYLKANLDILSGKVKDVHAVSEKDSDIATAAAIDENSVFGHECVIKPNVRIANSVLGSGVHVDEKAVIENSVIWPHCRISASSDVRECVIGRGSYIGKNAVLRPGSVIGDKAIIPDYSIV